MTNHTERKYLAEAYAKAIEEFRSHGNIDDADSITERARELDAARPACTSPPTHSAGNAVRALDRMTNACRNILAKQTIIADMAQRIEFWNAVEEAEALSAAHHTRKPKEK